VAKHIVTFVLVLGIDVSDNLLGRLTPEVRDTFCIYKVDSSAVVWLSQPQARRLPARVRRSQPAPHRWPNSIIGREVETVVRFVEKGRRRSRHGDVPAATWDAVANVLPNARSLAGTFPQRSGPNCFAAVMAACGVDGVHDVWMLREPFEDWLATHTAKGGHDHEPGTVLVWRRADGTAQHAAVTIGDGWALHKPSQGWMSPTKILTLNDVMYSARARGQYLHRRHLR
jgi:hypothetical protein